MRTLLRRGAWQMATFFVMWKPRVRPKYYLLSLLPQWVSSWGGSGGEWDDVCAAGVTVFKSALHAHDVGVQVHQPL